MDRAFVRSLPSAIRDAFQIDEGTNRRKSRGRHRCPGRIRRAVRLMKRGLKLKLLTRGAYLYIKNSQTKQLYGFFFCFSFNNDSTKKTNFKNTNIKINAFKINFF